MSEESLFDIEEVFSHFYRGCLNISEENVQEIRSFAAKHAESFKAFDGGVSISLKDDTFTILKSFRSIRKIIVKLDGSNNVAEKLGRAIQGFANLTDITLSGCALDNEGLMEVIDSIRTPAGIVSADFRNNPITGACIKRIRAKFTNIQSLLTDVEEVGSAPAPTETPFGPVPAESTSRRNVAPTEADLALYTLYYTRPYDRDCALKIKREADSGVPLAQAYMAKHYLSGNAVKKNALQSTKYGMLSLQWIRGLANSGHHCAQECMGYFYANAVGVVENQMEAQRYLLLAATQGNAVAQAALGHRYCHGVFVTKDAEEGLRWLLLAVGQQYPVACLLLGEAFYFGTGPSKDQGKAAEYFRAGVDLGNPVCIFNLGMQYSYGHGVGVNKVEAFRLFQLAVEKFDYAQASNQLAEMYMTGEGVREDKPRAVEILRRAAEGGDMVSQINLGSSYFYGTDVAQNETEAARYMKMAADQGNPKAQCSLGIMYLQGKGVAVDESEYARLTKLSAEAGYPDAMNNLGSIYLAGKGGVAQDKVRGALWIQLAAQKGNATAEKNYVSGGCAKILAEAGNDVPADLLEELKKAAAQTVKEAVMDFAKDKAKEQIQEGLSLAFSAVCVVM